MDSYICGGNAAGIFGADPFRNGIDSCCMAHTSAGRYKRALAALREGDDDIQALLKAMEDGYLGVLSAGAGMAKAWSRIYVEVIL